VSFSRKKLSFNSYLTSNHTHNKMCYYTCINPLCEKKERPLFGTAPRLDTCGCMLNLGMKGTMFPDISAKYIGRFCKDCEEEESFSNAEVKEMLIKIKKIRENGSNDK
jgi:hypothetical protein